MQNRKKE